MRAFAAFCIGVLVLLTGCAHHSSGKREKGPLTLVSSAFRSGGTIPINYSCAGANTSPPMAWHGAAPTGTKAWALVLTDADVRPGPWVQWLVTDIPVPLRTMSTGAVLPNTAVVNRVSNGTAGFVGVCPPAGKSHRYVFTVYALNKRLALPQASSAAQTLRAIDDAAISRTTLTARFAR